MEKAIKKIKKTMEKMEASCSMEYVKENVKISKILTIEINCIRADVGATDYVGTAIAFEVYAIKNGKAVDCVTVDTCNNVDEDILYLLKCWM